MADEERKALERVRATLRTLTPATARDDAIAFDLRYAARLMSDAAARDLLSEAVLNNFRRYAATALDAAADLLDKRTLKQDTIEVARGAVVMMPA
ncbi:MAG TPA: hypothetical protein VEK55_02895 [Xanthobacteraceae bacterium]|nr:hypothetical protein [Xanthobacteraceae bacterium]